LLLGKHDAEKGCRLSDRIMLRKIIWSAMTTRREVNAL